MAISPVLNEIFGTGIPVMVFAIPYLGHEWSRFGDLMNQPAGKRMACILTGDYRGLATAIRPFRAIHHLKESKILNRTTRYFFEYAENIRNKFGMEFNQVDLDRWLEACKSINVDSGVLKREEPIFLPESFFTSC